MNALLYGLVVVIWEPPGLQFSCSRVPWRPGVHFLAFCAGQRHDDGGAPELGRLRNLALRIICSCVLQGMRVLLQLLVLYTAAAHINTGLSR